MLYIPTLLSQDCSYLMQQGTHMLALVAAHSHYIHLQAKASATAVEVSIRMLGLVIEVLQAGNQKGTQLAILN